MSAAEKALAACVEYAKAKADVKRLSDEIGEALAGCYFAWDRANRGGTYESHLARAYAHEIGDIGCGEPGRIFLSKEEQAEVLAECPYCMAAHNAIQTRKEAKKRLGIAKRRISVIGRAAA